jgi:hypothetical protein
MVYKLPDMYRLEGELILKRTTILAVVIVIAIIVVVGVFVYLSYGSGTLQTSMTDPPAGWGDATQVYINYSAIQVHRADAGNNSGWFTAVDVSGWINLTQILDVNKTLGSKSLQAGTYNLIRFMDVEAIVTVNDVNYSATVPSDKLQIAITQGGVKINAGQTSNLLIELNIMVQGSITEGFTLVPGIRATPS